MSIAGGIVVFVVLWWLTLFAVLPWGVRPSDNPGDGHAEGAPEKPRLILKFVITTAVAAVLWLIFYAVSQSGWVSFRPL